MSTFRFRATETNCPVDMDVYLPSMKDSTPETKPVPAVVFFHGGGLTVGNRRSWFPDWFKGMRLPLSTVNVKDAG